MCKQSFDPTYVNEPDTDDEPNCEHCDEPLEDGKCHTIGCIDSKPCEGFLCENVPTIALAVTVEFSRPVRTRTGHFCAGCFVGKVEK